jgi:phosphonate transport system substrate-binding protein
MQMAALAAEGFEAASFFGKVLELGSAEEAVRRLISGAADAAFGWSSLAGEAEEGYSRGTLRELVARGEITMEQVVVVWRSAPIGHSPVALLDTMPEPDREKIEAYLLALATSNPIAYDLLDPFYGGGYAAVDAEDYDGLGVLALRTADPITRQDQSGGSSSD